MEVNKEKIGALLYTLRKEHNMTQAELAERIGVSNKSISRWETGQTMPDYSQVMQFCSLFGISASEFLSGELTAGDALAAAKTEAEPAAVSADESVAAENTPSESETDRKTASKKHTAQSRPRILWIAALAVVCVLTVLAAGIGSSCAGAGDAVAIAEQHFPDPQFRAWVANNLPHAASDRFTAEELRAVTEIDCSGQQIE